MSRGDKKTVIKSTDMTEEMQVEAVDTAKHVSLNKTAIDKIEDGLHLGYEHY
jgi:hypothetical protein